MSCDTLRHSFHWLETPLANRWCVDYKFLRYSYARGGCSRVSTSVPLWARPCGKHLLHVLHACVVCVCVLWKYDWNWRLYLYIIRVHICICAGKVNRILHNETIKISPLPAIKLTLSRPARRTVYILHNFELNKIQIWQFNYGFIPALTHRPETAVRTS